ncbi:SIMPL domain-containing protein [Subtercola boreus]|uniref:SIMPL domain-containing protein n=1 Tax=Subtercola boreus TaxID=120213 RepID=A0A3E0VZ16_9MICO|nr:SIMPL domain-containing protein [Subtercola boreus]RFA14990.1 SIMPL domain-containing protein [Subtercola boreus]
MVDTIITVEGHFDYHHPAERGTARLSTGFEGAEKAPVLSRTTEVHGMLAKQAERLRADGAVTWWSADRMRVWSDRPWSQDGAILPLVHHSAVALEVKFANLAALADWVESVAAEEGVTVSGIDWALTEVTKARITVEAQNGAVQDAVSRATAYARSLGLSTVSPLAVSDPGMLGGDTNAGASPLHDMAMMSRAAGGGASGGGLDLKPEDITVSSRVHARFAAS